MIKAVSRRGSGIVLTAFAALFCCGGAAAAEPWIRVSAPELDLYTTAAPKQAKELLARLEEVRSFFQKASPVRQISEMPLRIVDFRTAEEFQRYSPNRISTAFFTSGGHRDYIVLGPESQDNFGIAMHEYMHLILRHSGLKLPVWLNEGWADVYSTLRPMGRETAVGDLIPDRVEALSKGAWLDLDTLATVGSASPIYNESARAGIFYAESWALVHMLYLAPEYQANFPKFVYQLNAGRTMAEALQAAWGRSTAQIFLELQNYFKRKKLVGRVYESRADKFREEPQQSAVPDLEIGLIEADLLTMTGRQTEARAALEALERDNPGRAGVARARGDLAKARKDEEAERTEYETAFDEGEQDPYMCLELAQLEQRKGQLAKAVTVLERAVRVKPGFVDAEVPLGLMRMDLRRFDDAIRTFLAIDEIRPEMATAVFCGLATSYVQTGDFEAARAHLATCRKWAKSEVELKRAAQTAAFLEARAKPEAAVRKGEKRAAVAGMAMGVDCGTTGARLQVQLAGNKVAGFDLPMSAAVELMPAHGGQLTLKCGPMKPVPVAVEFAPPLTAIGNSSGVVRRVEY